MILLCQGLGDDCTTPLLDNMSLIQDEVNKFICKNFSSPQVLEMHIIVQDLGADNNPLVLSPSNRLGIC